MSVRTYDLALIWENGMTYNGPSDEVYQSAFILNQLFENELLELKLNQEYSQLLAFLGNLFLLFNLLNLLI